jgi:hypothetical protein
MPWILIRIGSGFNRIIRFTSRFGVQIRDLGSPTWYPVHKRNILSGKLEASPGASNYFIEFKKKYFSIFLPTFLNLKNLGLDPDTCVFTNKNPE